MNLPPPRAMLAGCMWLPRIVAKARLAKAGELDDAYAPFLYHPRGVDGQFLSFFRIPQEELDAAAAKGDDEVVAWFHVQPGVTAARIDEWNHIAPNLGRPGFPMADVFPIAVKKRYSHLADQGIDSVFELLETDEGIAPAEN